MKYIAPVFLLLITVVLLSFNHTQFSNPQTVNPIIGDESFISKFGYAPDETTDNQLRIVTHLAYAEELLRNKDVSHLSPEQQENRTMLLDLLHDYWTKGIFPKNYDRTESDLKQFSPDELVTEYEKNGLSTFSLVDTNNKNISKVLADIGQGKKLWKWCIVLVLIFMAFETLLLRFWK